MAATQAGLLHNKSAAAFRTTGEAAAELDVPTHVLRFWESKFPQVKPLKRGGGRRYYRPEDIDLLRRIRQSLYHEGYTIRGVQKLLRDGGGGSGSPSRPATRLAVPAEAAAAAAEAPPPDDLRAALAELRRELTAIRGLLDVMLQR